METSLLYFIVAAFTEIIGCYAFWVVLRDHKSWGWLVIGILALIFFAYLLTRVNLAFAGRAYAAYGGIYILASILWLITIEGTRPNQWDIIGTALSIAGAVVILMGSLTR